MAKNKIIHHEENLQMQVMEALQIKLPGIYAGTYHVPNGGFRHKFEASRLQRMGVKSGVPDLHTFLATKKYPSLYVELKASKKSRARPEQLAMIKALRDNGHYAIIKYDFDDIMKLYEYWWYHHLIYLKEREIIKQEKSQILMADELAQQQQFASAKSKEEEEEEEEI